jgi:peptidoglycan/xylan/chitin deacetylase (PgdA/CDA1 family)
LSAWPEGRRAAFTVSFDNLGEVTALHRGEWPEEEPLGRHFSVTRALPRIVALLEELGLRATFFVEGRNTELYPGTLTELAGLGHEVAYHGWCHENWADLARERETQLLERGVRAMDELSLRPAGFRPPGGRLTGASLELLRELGFAHCSPAGDGLGVEQDVAILPFRWAMVDAYHYLPRFGGLREADRGSSDPSPPAAFGEALDRALEEAVVTGRHLSVLFHPFLSDTEQRFAVLRRHLETVAALVDRATVWCAPYRDVASRVLDAPEAFDQLRLDARAA